VELDPMGGIVVALLRSGGRLDAVAADPDQIRWLRSETVADMPTDVITFPARGRGTATIWVDGEGRLVKEAYDLAPILRARAQASPNAKALPEAVKRIGESRLMVTIVHEGIELDKPIDPAQLLFRPPSGAREVAEFDESAEMPEWARVARRLVGKPAPQVTATRSDGTTWSSADLAGKPSILYFCAPWLAHCATEAGALAKMSGERGARLILVSEDPLDDMAAAFGQLLKPGLIFVVRDEGGLAAEKFEVVGIPAAVVVDDEGIVRAQCAAPDVTDAVGMALARIARPEKPK
jgi:peroxiredoxin